MPSASGWADPGISRADARYRVARQRTDEIEAPMTDSTATTDAAAPARPDVKIRRAIFSLTDKTGAAEFARALTDEFGVEIISTGGTARVLADAGVAVTPIEDVTGFPEMMDGRVKTLHPKVHGALLARRDLPSHMQDAARNGIETIDLVVVNLYAFEATIADPAVTFQDAVEHIDIGGPSMLRSAAKNHASVTVVTDPAEYDDILAEMRENDGATTLETRRRLALEVFKLTSAYDNAIYSWLTGELADDGVCGTASPDDARAFADDKRVMLSKAASLRYGENPHQEAAFYRLVEPGRVGGAPEGEAHTLAHAVKIQGDKDLSYNNYLDADAAWSSVREFETDVPTCVIIKHLTPCGIAQADTILDAYRKAWKCDTVSAYGGVMAFNQVVTAELAREIVEVNGQFIEVLIAPDYGPGALEVLYQKKNARILRTGGVNPAGSTIDLRSIEGGVVVQTTDAVAEDPAGFTVPTKTAPTDAQTDELLFAWKCAKCVKSNAVVLTRDHATVGIGGGQPNRVNSARIAVEQAGEEAAGAVVASDAFLPFPDTLEVVRDAGCTALIQPGGSIRDQASIDCADEAGIPMIFTGHRHFRH